MSTTVVDQFLDHLRNYSIQKSMGPNKKVLREMQDVDIKPISTLFEKPGNQRMPQCLREYHICFKKGTQEDLGKY